MPTGLYIHLPFCRQKCNYCDFASFAGREKQIPAYLEALAREAAQTPVKTFDTLYVGGGTPSLLAERELARLCQVLTDNFGAIGRFSESTAEANPESLTPGKIALLRGAGFKRLSIGLQSFCDQALKTLGRVHDVKNFLNAYQAARTGGFENINVDLIAGVPGQGLESFLEGLSKLIALRPEHISVYGLQIEEGTPFFARGVVCDQLLMRRMLEETHLRLQAAGYCHYEISNFALPGREARHNTNYWDNGPYIGLGSAAASYWERERRQNTPDVQEYIRRMTAGESPVVFRERLTGKAKEGETLMLAFRKLDGVELTPRQEKMFGTEIQKHLQSGLLERAGKKVKLSSEGLFLANEVFCSFVAPFEEL